MGNTKKAFVLGMARSGYEAAKLLINKDYQVVINDSKREQNPDHIYELSNLGVEIHLGEHPENIFDSTFDLLVKNPGIPNNHAYVEKARELHVPVINEMELAFRYFPKGVKIIGVTGTNGKTTTTAIIYRLLCEASKPSYLMGNMGYPVCYFVPLLKAGDIAVMEVSDHQLCNIVDYKTDISVFTNLSEAHLDFHGSYDIYKSMKRRIFNYHTESEISILNLDDVGVLALAENVDSVKKYFSSLASNDNGTSIRDGFIYYNHEKIISLDDLKLRGKHNYENIMAAITVVKEFDVDNKSIVNVLKSFGGVAHRLEYVTEINNISFYNDSKATNITSTQIALSSFEKPIILLLGGLDRGHSFSGLRDYLKNTKLILTYGQTKDRINVFATKNGIPCKAFNTLQEATEIAYASALPGDVVLLSPACASWDQYDNFETRGEMFKKYVNELSLKNM